MKNMYIYLTLNILEEQYIYIFNIEYIRRAERETKIRISSFHTLFPQNDLDTYHRSIYNIIKSLNQLHRCTFATATAAYESQGLTGSYFINIEYVRRAERETKIRISSFHTLFPQNDLDTYHRSIYNIIKSLNQLHRCTFATATAAYESQGLTGSYFKCKSLKNWHTCSGRVVEVN